MRANVRVNACTHACACCAASALSGDAERAEHGATLPARSSRAGSRDIARADTGTMIEPDTPALGCQMLTAFFFILLDDEGAETCRDRARAVSRAAVYRPEAPPPDRSARRARADVASCLMAHL